MGSLLSTATGGIIRNREVLDENYLPEALIHRDGQFQIIAKAIEPILHGRKAKNVLIYGPSGAGKTTTARFFLEKAKEETMARCAYVNCWENYRSFDVLQALFEDLSIPIAFGRVSTRDLIFKLHRLASLNPFILVLDEIDQLEEKRILYSIANLPIALILITNNDRALLRLDERIKARVSPLERVHFPLYKARELADILESRAHHGLYPWKANMGQIRRIAFHCSGNAHLAIIALRLAAERAEEENCDRILDRHIDYALDKAPRIPRTKSSENLNEHQKILVEIVKRCKRISGRDLHLSYKEEAKKKDLIPYSERTVRWHMEKLERYGFIKSQGYGRWKVYQVD